MTPDRAILGETLARLFRPPERLAAWQWADKYRLLRQGVNAEPGRWNTERTPWIRAALDAIDDPRYEMVVIWAAAQMGKTEAILNYIGARMMLNPTPIAYFGPDRQFVTDLSQDRLMPMIEDTPPLYAALAKGQANKILKKSINGCKLYMAWASSAMQLASKPFGLIFVDERSRMRVVSKEGDPVAIGQARGGTFAGFTTVVVSTVTEGLAIERRHPDSGLTYWDFPETIPDPTAALWADGTRQEWHIQCQHCRLFFVPRKSRLFIPDKGNIRERASAARLACPHCGTLMDEAEKAAANAAGVYCSPQWQTISPTGQVQGELPKNSIASFYWPGLASLFPGGAIHRRAEKLLRAQAAGDDDKLRAVLNVEFGELWTATGTTTDIETVKRLRGQYPMGDPPGGAVAITAGIDVQADRLVYVLRAWGDGELYTSWLVKAGELWGGVAGGDGSVWARLLKLLESDYNGLPVVAAAVDSGAFTHEVYWFCNENRHIAFPVKGRDTMDQPFKPSRIVYNSQGRLVQHAVKLWHVNTDYFKRWLTKRYTRPAGSPGAFNLALDVPDNYLEQIIAESRTRDARGRVVWRASGENHFFDAEVYATMAAFKEGLANYDAGDLQPENPPPKHDEAAWIPQTGGWL